MSRLPEWLCYDLDDDENVILVKASTLAEAHIKARVECGEIDWQIGPVTPAMRRRWRYHDRKDAGTLPPRKSRTKQPSPEAEAWFAGLGMMATLGMHDDRGRLRCATCRRYVTLDDLAGAATSASGGGVCIDFGPSCRRCRVPK